MVKKNTMIAIGHRGAAGHEPENTLLSIQKALDLGATWIEVDVHVCEGQLVVLHDEDLTRTTSGTGLVHEQTLDYVRSLDAGKGQQVPFLNEVLDLIQGKASINIELKGMGTAEPSVALIHERLESDWAREDFLLSSFTPSLIRRAKALDSGIRTGALFHEDTPDRPALARAMEAWSLNLNRIWTTPDVVAEAHELGLKVFVYTVNDLPEIERLHSIGVDGLFSDYPDLVLGYTNRLDP